MDTHTGWVVLATGFVMFLFVGIITISYFSMLPSMDTASTSPSSSLSPSASKTQSFGGAIQTQYDPGYVYIPQQLPISPATAMRPQNTCFNMNTVTANRLVGLIMKNNLQSKYAPLIMTYSALVCVYQDIQNQKCDRIEGFLGQLIVFGGSPHSPSGMTELSYYTEVPSKPSLTKSFLIAAMDVISNYMSQLINENTISEQDRSSLKGFNYEFCRNYLDPINRACPV